MPEPAEETAPVCKLLEMDGRLVCGDAWGGIRTYEWTRRTSPNVDLPSSRLQRSLLQFRGFGIACMERAGEHLLAVSLRTAPDARALPSAAPLRAAGPCGIHIVDTKTAAVAAVLDAHRDVVQCLRSLPDGSFLSAGGKMDATVRVWESSADETGDGAATWKAARILEEPGYVFDVQVLPDSRRSGVYAVAAARYNVIKIVI